MDNKSSNIATPGLANLASGTTYRLEGTSQNHINNHYGTLAVNTALQNIANDYSRTHNNEGLRYNDQSLVWGGVFDISGDWDPSGPDGHKSHACGTDIDVGITGTKGGRIVATDLARLVQQHYPGAFVFNEGGGRSPHYHIHFADCV